MSETLPNYDALFCGKQPVHQTNQIQSHGVLIVVDKTTFNIIQVSENVDELTNISARDIINTPLINILTTDSFTNIINKTGKQTSDVNEVIPVTFIKGDTKNKYFSTLHEIGGALIIEVLFVDIIENEVNKDLDLFQKLNHVMSAVNAATSVKNACEIAATEIKKISAYDRVMIYFFDEEWNGTVIAQEMEEGMEDYLGLKFPASDIPKPVRDLYYINPIRIIPNRDYTPISLYPEVSFTTGGFTDLSKSKLRSVIGVHLEYLKNMGITATLSTRIIHHQKLWGLISCNHRTAKYISFKEAILFELLSNIISSKISSLTDLEADKLKAERDKQLTELVNNVQIINDIPKGLKTNSVLLLQFLSADGCIIKWNDAVEKAGLVPGEQELEALVDWLKLKEINTTVHIPALSEVFENASIYADIASGILVLPVLPEAGNFIIAFRREVVKSVSWGGNPNDAVKFEPDSTVYHPRNSFNLWRQTVRNTAIPWLNGEVEAAEKFRIALVEFALSRKNKNLQNLINEFEFVTNFIPQIIWSSQPEGGIDYYNEQFFKFTGLDFEAAKGEKWTKLIHPEDLERFSNNWLAAIKGETFYENEFRVRGSNNVYRWFLARALPFKDDDGKIIKWYGSWTDVHDRKLMEEVLENTVEERTKELKKSNSSLENANNELTQFVKVISHDLQEPVRKIHLFSNILKDRFFINDNSEISVHLDKIIKASYRIKTLIADLVDFSNLSVSTRFEKTDLNIVVQDVLKVMEPELSKKNIKVSVSGLGEIDAIPAQMDLLLQNFISNCIKFSRHDVQQFININGIKVASLSFTAPESQEGDYLKITIVDNGIGFDEKFVDIMFKLFQRLNKGETYGGTGLGLPLIKKIVEIHSGIITATGKEQEGAVFTIVLPVNQTG